MTRWFDLNVYREEQRRIYKEELSLPLDQRSSYVDPFSGEFPHKLSLRDNDDGRFDNEILPWCTEQFGPGGRALYRSMDFDESENMIDFDAPWMYYAGVVYFKNESDALFCKIRWA